jgi:sporulation protein YlmC with PRC-barrel domain
LALKVPQGSKSDPDWEMPLLTIAKPTSVSVSTLAGYRVRSHENDDLGTIEEIIIHPESGRVTYAVLCFGGTFAFGDRLFAVPWDLLRLDAVDRVLILDWDCGKLDGAPAFEQDDWPDFTDESWEREIQNYYGLGKVKPSGE